VAVARTRFAGLGDKGWLCQLHRAGGQGLGCASSTGLGERGAETSLSNFSSRLRTGCRQGLRPHLCLPARWHAGWLVALVPAAERSTSLSRFPPPFLPPIH
jgi:hypothetical protein